MFAIIFGFASIGISFGFLAPTPANVIMPIIGVILGVVALVMGAIGVKKAEPQYKLKKKKVLFLALVGIIWSAIALVIGVLIMLGTIVMAMA